MQLYDSIIRDTLEALSARPARSYAYAQSRAWKDNGASELVMQRDAAYELGGDDKPAVSISPASRVTHLSWTKTRSL